MAGEGCKWRGGWRRDYLSPPRIALGPSDGSAPSVEVSGEGPNSLPFYTLGTGLTQSTQVQAGLYASRDPNWYWL